MKGKWISKWIDVKMNKLNEMRYVKTICQREKVYKYGYSILWYNDCELNFIFINIIFF